MNESTYKGIEGDKLKDLLSNFLIDSWSFSKVASFSRNEKAFEMTAIYRQRTKSSSTSVAGSAYHEALDYYFTNHPKNENNSASKNVDIISMEQTGFEYINNFPSNIWKVQKTTPTVEDCVKKATLTVKKGIEHFYQEREVYESEMKRIIEVEVYCDEWLTINGVDIPLPCHAKIDLVIETHDGRIVVIDHKLRASHSDEKELKLSIGKQAITYVKCYESRSGLKVDEVWFVENKHSVNRDKSKKQLNAFKVLIDNDTQRLYEALLYEPLKRMIEAVSDPDYVYMMNEDDNFIDSAELHQFWAMTMIAEVEDFNVPDNKKEIIRKRLKKVRDASLSSISPSVIKHFKESASQFIQYDLSNSDMTLQERIEHVLRTFGIICSVDFVFDGYSSNTYLLSLSAGIKIQSVHARKLDIANALDVANVRIMPNLFVHEGKSYVAIESSKPRIKDLFWDKKYLDGKRIPIGKDNFDKVVFWDLNNQSTPHVLLCGGTGSGKSVSLISSVEYAIAAGVDQVEIFDPKYEFTSYKSKPNVNVFQEIEDIEGRAKELVEQMNSMIAKGEKRTVLVVLDEFADAYMMSKTGKELDIREMVKVGEYKPTKSMPFGGDKMAMKTVGKMKSLEENIQSLLQKGRSSGFRLMLATQRADTKVINGNAKVNLPVQICFRVQKEVDSKVVLDEGGAETLAGNGDGLIRSPEYPETIRFQSFYKP